MTLDLPDAVPLPDPPGSPQLLGDVVDGVRAAALDAWVLDVRLAAPVAATPGWQGTDAEAAAVQLATTRVVAGDLYLALSTGATRLDRHRELMEDVRAQLSALREEQDADRAGCAARMPSTAGIELATDPTLLASAQVVRDGYRERDAGRATRHADLVQELADDATAAAAELTTALAPVSGGARGAAAVTAHLAGVLPGWGTPELTGLGFELGQDLAGATDEEARALLSASADLLATPAAAAAALLVLGEGGLTRLLQASALDETGPPVRRRLGELVGRLVDSALGVDDRRRVVGLLDRAIGGQEHGGVLDPVLAVGWGLLARTASLPTPVLLRLAGSLVADERASSSARSESTAVLPGCDPLADVLAGLVRSGDHEAAASFLSVAATWDVLYARVWPGGLEAFKGLIDSAARASGEAPATVMVNALGSAGRTVDVQYDSRATGGPHAFTIAAVADEVARLVAGNLDALVDPLTSGQHGVGAADPLSEAARDLVRGLGMITVPGTARLTVVGALTTTTALDLTDPLGRDDRTTGYLAGAVLAGVAWGERFHQELDVLASARRSELPGQVFDLVTMPVALIKGVKGFLAGQIIARLRPDSMSPEAIVDEMSMSRETASAEVALLMQAAGFAATVPTGQLPSPGLVSDGRRTGSAAEFAAAARDQYEALLTAPQEEVYAELVDQENAAVAAFSSLEDQVRTVEQRAADDKDD